MAEQNEAIAHLGQAPHQRQRRATCHHHVPGGLPLLPRVAEGVPDHLPMPITARQPIRQPSSLPVNRGQKCDVGCLSTYLHFLLLFFRRPCQPVKATRITSTTRRLAKHSEPPCASQPPSGVDGWPLCLTSCCGGGPDEQAAAPGEEPHSLGHHLPPLHRTRVQQLRQPRDVLHRRVHHAGALNKREETDSQLRWAGCRGLAKAFHSRCWGRRIVRER